MGQSAKTNLNGFKSGGKSGLSALALVILAILPSFALGRARPPSALAAMGSSGLSIEAFAAQAMLTVATDHPSLQTTQRQPRSEPVTVVLSSPQEWRIEGRIKTLPTLPEWVWLDLYVVNSTNKRARNIEVSLESSLPVIDVSDDPFATEPAQGALQIPTIAPHGVAQRSVLLSSKLKTHEIRITTSGVWTNERQLEVNSSPIVVTPDGQEVWAALADANAVTVVDTATNQSTQSISVDGYPTSLAITPDGRTVLVTSARSNQVTVIDRAARRIVQTLGEGQGLGREPRHIVMGPDGNKAYVSEYVSDRIAQLQRSPDGTFQVVSSLGVGRRPLGMSLSADGSSLFVSHFLPRGTSSDNETWVSAIDTASFASAREVVWRDFGNLQEAECLSKKIGAPADQLQFEGVGTQLAGVFLPPGGEMGWIPGLRTGPVAIWESAPDRSIPGVGRATFSPAFLFFMRAQNAASAAIKLNPQVLDVPDASLDFLRCAKLDYDTESVVATKVPGEENTIFSNGAAVPTSATALSETGVARFVAFTPGGRRALVLSHSADELQVFDAVTQQNLSRRNLRLTGSNPLGMALLPDGSKGYVLYENSMFLSVLDLSAYASPERLPVATHVPYEYRRTDNPNNSFLTESRLVRFIADVPELPEVREIAQITLLAQDPMPAQVRRGKTLFQSSNPEKYPELSASRQSSCGTCHPSGGHDGTVWGTMEGERRTMSLYGGVAGRGWLHQSGTHTDALEFAEIIVPERLGGSGLNHDDYTALAEYLSRHIPTLQGPKVDAVRAARGQVLFQQACASCHAGPSYSGGMPDPENKWGGGGTNAPILVDVGTTTSNARVLIPSFFTQRLPSPAREIYDLLRGDRDLGSTDPVQEILGFRPRPDRKRNEIRPPSLNGVWDYTVFFHDGRYEKLEDVMEHLNQNLGLGLSKDDLADVTEYVKTL
jgi:YVTN family beta-propeller protein